MKKILLVIIILTICIFLVVICWIKQTSNTTYEEIRNYTITSIDVRNNRVIIEGHMHGPGVIDDYLSRIEDNTMYIKILLKTWPFNNSSSSKFFKYDQPLSDNIEKIFIEDNEKKIVVWDKSQGYNLFNIEDTWKAELQKLKRQK